MQPIDYSNLRARIDGRLNAMIGQFYAEVPGATWQRDSTQIHPEYYKRHCIETILRIRHKRMIDALVIHYFTKNDSRQAKAWAAYIEDEMLHGHMFARDMERLFGIQIEEIYRHEPLFATKLLNGYFYFTLEHEGPMAALTSAYFLEYTTRMTQPHWLDNLTRIFGEENVRGARAHVNHDIREDHNHFAWDVLKTTIRDDKDIERFERHLENIYGLFAAYFTELYLQTDNTVAAGSGNIVPGAAIKHAYSANRIMNHAATQQT